MRFGTSYAPLLSLPLKSASVCKWHWRCWFWPPQAAAADDYHHVNVVVMLTL